MIGATGATGPTFGVERTAFVDSIFFSDDPQLESMVFPFETVNAALAAVIANSDYQSGNQWRISVAPAQYIIGPDTMLLPTGIDIFGSGILNTALIGSITIVPSVAAQRGNNLVNFALISSNVPALTLTNGSNLNTVVDSVQLISTFSGPGPGNPVNAVVHVVEGEFACLNSLLLNNTGPGGSFPGTNNPVTLITTTSDNFHNVNVFRSNGQLHKSAADDNESHALSMRNTADNFHARIDDSVFEINVDGFDTTSARAVSLVYSSNGGQAKINDCEFNLNEQTLGAFTGSIDLFSGQGNTGIIQGVVEFWDTEIISANFSELNVPPVYLYLNRTTPIWLHFFNTKFRLPTQTIVPGRDPLSNVLPSLSYQVFQEGPRKTATVSNGAVYRNITQPLLTTDYTVDPEGDEHTLLFDTTDANLTLTLFDPAAATASGSLAFGRILYIRNVAQVNQPGNTLTIVANFNSTVSTPVTINVNSSRMLQCDDTTWNIVLG